MHRPALRVVNLSKQYRIGAKQESYRTLRDTIVQAFRSPIRRLHTSGNETEENTIWPLRDISFEVQPGEMVGIIGRNGAGKSTLLKILSRITEPTRGFVEIYGRVGSLLEVGTGFHPELTGRENTFLNGAILGMKRAEIQRQFDAIIAFAEVEKFIDTPVKHYSSGMYLRLAFAVAAHLDPEILLVDEVLAVGDLNFQKKCTGKMGEVARSGRTVLFVSHNMAAVRQLCGTAIMLSGGRIAASGKLEDVIRTYIAASFPSNSADLSAAADRKGEGKIRFRSLRIEDESGFECATLAAGRPARIILAVTSAKTYPNIRVWISFVDTYDQKIMHLDSFLVGDIIPRLPPNGELVCDIPRVSLAPGRYRLHLWMQSSAVLQDSIENGGTIDVIDGNFFGTGRQMIDGRQVALMDFSWRARESTAEDSSDRAASAAALPNQV